MSISITILFSILIYLGISQACIFSSFSQVNTTTATSNDTALTFGTYSSTSGIDGIISGANIGTPIMIKLLGWGLTDNTVLIAKFTASSGVGGFYNNNATSNNVASRSASSATNVFFGFKASVGSIMIDVLPSATTGSFNIQIYSAGWNNNLNCQKTCSKTIFQYTYISLAVPGQYDCFVNNLKSIFILMIFVFFIL